MPKISQFTAQTGASVANGDLFPIVDVGSPNVSEYITADELAQAPQFSSRYKPLASDRIWLPAQTFTAVVGSPSMGTLGNALYGDTRQPVMLFSHTAAEYAATTWLTPQGWATFDAYLWWSNAGAGSGDVFWGSTIITGSFGDGDTTDTGSYLGDKVTTSPAQYIAKRTKLNSGSPSITVGEINRMLILRGGDNVLDTLGNQAGMIGIEIVRAS